MIPFGLVAGFADGQEIRITEIAEHGFCFRTLDEIREGEIPVFWACGVTPQAAVERAKPPIVITHAPGHMFITNVKNAELNDYLEKKKQGTKSL